MKTSSIVLIVLIALAAGLVGLWSALDLQSTSSSPAGLDEKDVPVVEAALRSDATRVVDDALEEAASPSSTRNGIGSLAKASDAGVGAVAGAGPAMHGRLLDVATLEPLPAFLLVAEAATGQVEQAMTDAAGRFQLTTMPAEGDVHIQPIDRPGRKVQDRITITAIERTVEGEIAVRVASGPTFRLAITNDPAIDATTLRARLLMPDNKAVGADEPVHADKPPWVRLPPVPSNYDRSRAIEIKSAEGLWQGEANVAAVRGIVPEFVSVTLLARAVVDGIVRDPDGTAVAGAEVALEDRRGKSSALKTTDERGHFRFELRLPGEAALNVRSLRFETNHVPIVLVAGSVLAQDVTLARLPAVGSIRGRIISESGTYAADVRIRLSMASKGPRSGLTLQASPAWNSVDGRKVAVFDFADLPAATYRLSVEHGDELEFVPSKLELAPPADDVEFVVRDATPNASLAFRVHDSANGAELGALQALLRFDNNIRKKQTVDSGAIVVVRYPLEKKLAWRLDREGYVPALGDERSFAIEERGERGVVHFAEVNLDPGWGDFLEVNASNTGKPIADAKVEVDGRDAGRTDERGHLFLRNPTVPANVTIAHDNMRPTTIHPNADPRSPHDFYTMVALAPAKGKANSSPR